jgi:hypothetical protein
MKPNYAFRRFSRDTTVLVLFGLLDPGDLTSVLSRLGDVLELRQVILRSL